MVENKLAKPNGRPSVMTEEVVNLLENIFKLDVPIQVAVEYAGIDESTYYRHYKSNHAFARRMERAKIYARIAATNVVMDAIVKDKDVQSARWWLEKRHSEEFKAKPDLLQDNRTQINYFSNYEQLAEQLYRLSRHTLEGGNPPESPDLD